MKYMSTLTVSQPFSKSKLSLFRLSDPGFALRASPRQVEVHFRSPAESLFWSLPGQFQQQFDNRLIAESEIVRFAKRFRDQKNEPVISNSSNSFYYLIIPIRGENCFCDG